MDACGDKGESRRPATIAARTTEFLAPHVQRCDKARRALKHDNLIATRGRARWHDRGSRTWMALLRVGSATTGVANHLRSGATPRRTRSAGVPSSGIAGAPHAPLPQPHTSGIGEGVRPTHVLTRTCLSVGGTATMARVRPRRRDTPTFGRRLTGGSTVSALAPTSAQRLRTSERDVLSVRASECPSIRAIRPPYLLSPSMCVPPTRVPSTRAEQKRTPNAEGEAQGFGHGNRPHSLVKKARRTR